MLPIFLRENFQVFPLCYFCPKLPGEKDALHPELVKVDLPQKSPEKNGQHFALFPLKNCNVDSHQKFLEKSGQLGQIDQNLPPKKSRELRFKHY